MSKYKKEEIMCKRKALEAAQLMSRFIGDYDYIYVIRVYPRGYTGMTSEAFERREGIADLIDFVFLDGQLVATGAN